jgi:hypothetical protein
LSPHACFIRTGEASRPQQYLLWRDSKTQNSQTIYTHFPHMTGIHDSLQALLRRAASRLLAYCRAALGPGQGAALPHETGGQDVGRVLGFSRFFWASNRAAPPTIGSEPRVPTFLSAAGDGLGDKTTTQNHTGRRAAICSIFHTRSAGYEAGHISTAFRSLGSLFLKYLGCAYSHCLTPSPAL